MESVAASHLSGTEIGTTLFARSHLLSSKQIPPWLEASWAQAEACGQLPGPGPGVLVSPSQESQPQASGSERESGTLGLGALSSGTDSTFNWLGTWASHLTSSGCLLPHLPNGSCDSCFHYLPAQTEEESSIPTLQRGYTELRFRARALRSAGSGSNPSSAAWLCHTGQVSHPLEALVL